MDVKYNMKSARDKVVPKTPNTLKELGELLSKYDKYHGFYRTTVVLDDERDVIIFISNTMVKALKEAKELMGDGTFRVSDN